MRCWLARASCILALSSAPMVAHAQSAGGAATDEDSLARARHAFEQALRHYRAGEYREAIDDLERALQHDPGGEDLVYNLALVHEKLGDLDRAIENFRRYANMERDPAEQKKVEATIRRLEGARAEAAPAPSSDDPGLLAEWRDSEASQSPPAAERGSRVDGWVIGAGAVSVAALAVGAFLGVRALSTEPATSDGTGVDESISELRDRQRRAHSFAVIADVAFAIALVSGGTAATLYVLRGDDAPRAAAPARPGRTVGMSVGGRF